eukprot:2912475-Amphidinium_carterae.1
MALSLRQDVRLCRMRVSWRVFMKLCTPSGKLLSRLGTSAERSRRKAAHARSTRSQFTSGKAKWTKPSVRFGRLKSAWIDRPSGALQ